MVHRPYSDGLREFGQDTATAPSFARLTECRELNKLTKTRHILVSMN